jgi:formate dehydrogenase major subunit
MRLSRRNLLKLAGTTTTAAMALNLGISISDVSAETVKLRTLEAKETPSICTFCSVGCGIIAQTVNGKMIHTEGDPDNPNNQGSLCSKGAAALQMSTNDQRVRQVLYRAPGANAWENRSWEWAIKRIAELTKKTRDESFQLFNSEGTMVSRTDAIGSLGSSMINNEDLYLISKFARGIGVTYLEHQARLCHSSTVGGLAPTFGRGAMTNHWQDMKNTHVALICGSNAAENHPVAMKWLQKARDNNKAKIIHVDPRFTRTSAYSDLYCPIRSGTNIAFYSGMMHYILENERYHKEYLIHYTNAASLIDERYSFDEVTGLFNGFDEASASYKQKNTWDYQRDEEGNVLKDETLQHPRSVFQIMKKHYARYTLEKTAAACGAPQDKLEQVYDLYTSTGQAGKAGTILYAMGQTQFTSGSQNIRSMGVIQLLLGNIGIPGGGVNALRGHSNVQGSTDMGLLFHYLPGYMPAPEDNLKTLAEYNATTPAAPAYWSNRPKFITSQLKSWWGDAATPENDFAYGWIPKRKAGKNHSHIAMFEDMLAGNVKGLYCWGQNPVVAGSDSKLESKALENLDWLVCMDPFETETSTFWKRPGANPSEIGTEVFLLPAATFLEKDGTITNSGRVIQYRWKTVDGQGAVKPEFYALDHIVKRLKGLYANSARPEDEPIK